MKNKKFINIVLAFAIAAQSVGLMAVGVVTGAKPATGVKPNFWQNHKAATIAGGVSAGLLLVGGAMAYKIIRPMSKKPGLSLLAKTGIYAGLAGVVVLALGYFTGLIKKMLGDGSSSSETEGKEIVSLEKGTKATSGKAPFVYDDGYNIGLFGFEKLHSFDTKKYAKVYQSLLELGIQKDQFYKPGIVTDKELESVHTQEYLASLGSSTNVLKIAELLPGSWLAKGACACIPNWLLQKKLLNPMRRATAGTALAAELALETKKNFVNIGGGYHHAKRDSGGGFCYFADIPYAVNCLWKKNPDLKVMVIDLDAHQGNGHEDIFKDDKRISIFDIYGGDNYPRDVSVKRYITYDYPVWFGIEDSAYLDLIEKNLGNALERSKPDLIIYNAGTDPFKNDPLGKMSISKNGLVMRDELVFKFAQERHIPVCMVTSGGYSNASAEIISDSLKNLIQKKYIVI